MGLSKVARSAVRRLRGYLRAFVVFEAIPSAEMFVTRARGAIEPSTRRSVIRQIAC
jgi:hypothetical protein